MRRFVFAIALLACAVPLSAPAAQSWEDVSTQTALAALDFAPPVFGVPHVAVVRFARVPNAAPVGYLTNFVAAGIAQSGVPCFDCVGGASTGFNVGLTAPYNYITTGETAQYSLSFTNITNTAFCKLSWAIAAGKTVLDAFSYTIKSPGTYSSYVYGFDRSRPSYSGPAILAGKVMCKGAGSQTAKLPLIFQ